MGANAPQVGGAKGDVPGHASLPVPPTRRSSGQAELDVHHRPRRRLGAAEHFAEPVEAAVFGSLQQSGEDKVNLPVPSVRRPPKRSQLVPGRPRPRARPRLSKNLRIQISVGRCPGSLSAIHIQITRWIPACNDLHIGPQQEMTARILEAMLEAPPLSVRTAERAVSTANQPSQAIGAGSKAIIRGVGRRVQRNRQYHCHRWDHAIGQRTVDQEGLRDALLAAPVQFQITEPFEDLTGLPINTMDLQNQKKGALAFLARELFLYRSPLPNGADAWLPS
jgi:hypothetical protein